MSLSDTIGILQSRKVHNFVLGARHRGIVCLYQSLRLYPDSVRTVVLFKKKKSLNPRNNSVNISEPPCPEYSGVIAFVFYNLHCHSIVTGDSGLALHQLLFKENAHTKLFEIERFYTACHHAETVCADQGHFHQFFTFVILLANKKTVLLP